MTSIDRRRGADRGAKGRRMEELLLSELQESYRMHGIPILSTWITHRCRARGDRDFLGCWDVAILAGGNPARYLCLYQVKSEYRPSHMEALRRGVTGNYCCLAVYNEPPGHVPSFKMGHFWLIHVEVL